MLQEMIALDQVIPMPITDLSITLVGTENRFSRGVWYLKQAAVTGDSTGCVCVCVCDCMVM